MLGTVAVILTIGGILAGAYAGYKWRHGNNNSPRD